jgi:hypothetical protein
MALIELNLVRIVVFLAILAPAHVFLAIFGKHLPYSFYYKNDVEKLAKLEDQRRADSGQALNEIRAEMQRLNMKGPLFTQPGSKELCVSITSVARPGRKYLSQTLAALLTRMPLRFQDRIKLTLFNAELDPSDHHEALGLSDLVNIVNVRYEKNLDPSKSTDVRRFAKELLDYLYTTRETYAMGCRYNLLLEDDALASTNWMEDLEVTLRKLEESKEPWLMMRLFSTFKWIGFSKDNFSDYVLLFLFTVVLAAIVYVSGLGILALISLFKRGKSSWEPLSDDQTPSSSFLRRYKSPDLISTALLLALAFALVLLVGKQTIIYRGDGIHDVAIGASCVANLHPRDGLKLLIDYLDAAVTQHGKSNELYLMPRKDQFFDYIVTDQYEKTGKKYAELLRLPNLFQHIGVWTSLGKFSSPETAVISHHYRDDDVRIQFSAKKWKD